MPSLRLFCRRCRITWLAGNADVKCPICRVSLEELPEPGQDAAAHSEVIGYWKRALTDEELAQLNTGSRLTTDEELLPKELPEPGQDPRS